MKVYISNYRYHWFSPYVILEKVIFWREINYDEPIIEKWANRIEPFLMAINKVLDVIHPKINYVKIDGWDAYSMDHTLGYIILPMLKMVNESKQGAPHVDDCDVPMELWSTSAPEKEDQYDVDGNHFKRWDWVLGEMIWAFEQLMDDKSDSKFFDHSDVDPTQSLQNQINQTKYDVEGHRAWGQRKSNGFRLFGKYYESLWT